MPSKAKKQQMSQEHSNETSQEQLARKSIIRTVVHSFTTTTTSVSSKVSERTKPTASRDVSRHVVGIDEKQNSDLVISTESNNLLYSLDTGTPLSSNTLKLQTLDSSSASPSKIFNTFNNKHASAFGVSPLSLVQPSPTSAASFATEETYLNLSKTNPIYSMSIDSMKQESEGMEISSETDSLIQPHELHPLYLPEILMHIFSFLETPLNTGTDPTQPIDFVKVDSIKYTISKPKLHSCVLVNKLWNACATKILWKNIKVGSEVATKRLTNILMGGYGGMMQRENTPAGTDSRSLECWISKEEPCDFHSTWVSVPSRVNGWEYGKLIKSFTLIPPHVPQSDSVNFDLWNVDEVVNALALCCPNLEELNLSNCNQVTDAAILQVAKHCSKLQKLNLNRCDQVSTTSIMELEKCCKKLVIFNLSRPLLVQKTTVSDDALFKIVHNLENVMELRLRNCDQTSDRTVICAAKTSNINLRALDLSWCNRITDNSICLGVAMFCPQLQSLALNGCKKLTDRSIMALLTNCPNISSLSLAHLPFITNVVLQSMAPQLKNLSILSLNGCSNVADSSIRALAENCPSLQSLSLFSLKISDDAVASVADQCRDLISLSISGCTRVTDKGAMKIMALTKLQSLYLNGAQITDRSIISIAFHCPLIRALSLNDCQMLTDKAIISLSRCCSQIQSLSMNNCGVTAVGVKALIDRLPDLRELSIKQCTKCILAGEGADVPQEGSGNVGQSVIGSLVLNQLLRRKIALMR